MCCTAACMKFLVGWSYICSSRRTSSCLFVQKVVNIFFCTVWSLLICTPAVTHAEINHLGLSLNPCEWPAVSLWPSSTRFSLYISESCFVKTSVFALKHVLKYSVGFAGRVPFFFVGRCKASTAGGTESNGIDIDEFPSLILGTATQYCNCFNN